MMDQLSIPSTSISSDAFELLMSNRFPVGNFREIKKTIEAAHIFSGRSVIDESHLRIVLKSSASVFAGVKTPSLPSGMTATTKEGLEEAKQGVERQFLVNLGKRFKGNLSRMSAHSGFDRKHLRNLLKKHGLTPKE